MRWRSYRGEPIRTHPIVAESMRELLNKSENERSGVFSTAMSFFRSTVTRCCSEHGTVGVPDLGPHESRSSRVSLPRRASFEPRPPQTTDAANLESDRPQPHDDHELPERKSDRRLQTSAPADARRISGSWPSEIFSDALALIAGYGLRACLIAQDLSQIHAAYGHDEAITSNCHTRVAFTPNRVETARLLSQMAGKRPSSTRSAPSRTPELRFRNPRFLDRC